jgi:hypothetical protein
MKKKLAILAIVLFISTLSFAIDYGDFVGNTLWFVGVGETEGYFGAPQVIGDSIIFSPQDFAVETIDGGIDYKNGHMWMTFLAKPGKDIDSIEIEEYGDYSLFGLGTENTYVEVSALATIRIEQVEGVDLVNPLEFQFEMLYKKSSDAFWDDGKFDLINDGAGAELWEGELNINVDQLLVDAGLVGKATKIYFTMDNILFAQSENGTIAQIEKKSVGGFVVTVPEPSTVLLLGLGCLGLLRRKRQ